MAVGLFPPAAQFIEPVAGPDDGKVRSGGADRVRTRANGPKPSARKSQPSYTGQLDLRFKPLEHGGLLPSVTGPHARHGKIRNQNTPGPHGYRALDWTPVERSYPMPTGASRRVADANSTAVAEKWISAVRPQRALGSPPTGCPVAGAPVRCSPPTGRRRYRPPSRGGPVRG